MEEKRNKQIKQWRKISRIRKAYAKAIGVDIHSKEAKIPCECAEVLLSVYYQQKAWDDFTKWAEKRIKAMIPKPIEPIKTIKIKIGTEEFILNNE